MMFRESSIRWARLAEVIAERLGLSFPRERQADLKRGLESAAREMGYSDVAALCDQLLSTSISEAHLQKLAAHLTTGETYFYRDKPTFDLLASIVLPELIQSRRGSNSRLRLWSAGCCTGEEAYSLAIVVHQLIPDPVGWQISILGSDVNPRFLRIAAGGVYGNWSFRGVPPGFRERFFNRREDGRYVILPQIKKMVTFRQLNLAENEYPSHATDTNDLDLILCRNVLMYFTQGQIRRVVANLHASLVGGGWLSVSASEASHRLFSEFIVINHPDTILYRKQPIPPAGLRRHSWDLPDEPFDGNDSIHEVQPPSWVANTDVQSEEQPLTPPNVTPSGPVGPETAALTEATSLYEQGRYSEAAVTLLDSVFATSEEPESLALLTRVLANLGRYTEALMWCDRWIAADRLDPSAHYLRAIMLSERGELDQAHRSLQRATYLRPEFVLAHVALGNLARGRKKHVEAEKHFNNALQLLGRYEKSDSVPESDGLSAGGLVESIRDLMTKRSYADGLVSPAR